MPVDHASSRAKVVVVRRREECFEIAGEIEGYWVLFLLISEFEFAVVRVRVNDLLRSVLKTIWNVGIEYALGRKYVEAAIAYETLSIVFRSTVDQARKIFYVNVMGVERVRVIDQKQIRMMFSVTFVAQIFDTKSFVIAIQGDDVDAYVGILGFEFGNLFDLDRKVDSVEI